MPALQVGRRIVVQRDGQVDARRRRRAGRPRPCASRPARNMSWASARREPGRSRTRLPRATATPSTTTPVGLRRHRAVGARVPPRACRAWRVRPARRRSSGVRGAWPVHSPQVADRAVQPVQQLRRHACRPGRCRSAARCRSPAPRASRASVRAIVRSVRISSISVASNRSPGLSGAIGGWSYRMIGEDSSRSRGPRRRPAPARCGGCRSSPRPAWPTPAGRVRDRNSPPGAPSRQVGGDQRVPQGDSGASPGSCPGAGVLARAAAGSAVRARRAAPRAA